MSENVEAVRDFILGLASGTPTAMRSLDPKIDWHVEDTLPDPQVWHGHEGVEQFFAGLREVWRQLRFEGTDYIGEDDWVLVTLRQVGYGTQSQVPVEQILYGVFRMRDGCAVRLDVYFDRGRAREAVGLSE